MIAKALQNDQGVILLGQTNNCVKQVAESLHRNRICSRDDMTLLVSPMYLSAHKREYDPSYSRTEIGHRYTPVVLSTLSMAKRLQGKDLQEFRNAAGNFQERSTAVVDEGGRISLCSFAELLPALGTVKRLVVGGDREQGGPFS